MHRRSPGTQARKSVTPTTPWRPTRPAARCCAHLPGSAGGPLREPRRPGRCGPGRAGAAPGGPGAADAAFGPRPPGTAGGAAPERLPSFWSGCCPLIAASGCGVGAASVVDVAGPGAGPGCRVVNSCQVEATLMSTGCSGLPGPDPNTPMATMAATTSPNRPERAQPPWRCRRPGRPVITSSWYGGSGWVSSS